jgi:hypothetical protein
MLPSDQAERRRDERYPVRLPVTVKLATTEMSAQSENLSLRGILLSSNFLIPEGSTVGLEIGVARLPEHDLLLTASGKVLRLLPQTSGKFAIAVACDHCFRITPRRLKASFKPKS